MQCPPFYRRLAALAQAALLCRRLFSSGIEINELCEWSLRNRYQPFYLQSLTDMRLEPRWYPDLAVASQLKANFFSRIEMAASLYSESLRDHSLYKLILGTEAKSIVTLMEFPDSYLPGPLEGTEDIRTEVPTELSKVITTQLNTGVAEPSSFIALVDSALLFRIESDSVRLAASVLELAQNRLANVHDKSQLLGILNGLATVAAVARSHELADQLRITLRGYRRDTQYCLSNNEEMRICLVASASRSDLTEWRDFVGDWLTELSFGKLKNEEAKELHSQLLCLCHSTPELWVSCGRADAAFTAFINH